MQLLSGLKSMKGTMYYILNVHIHVHVYTCMHSKLKASNCMFVCLCVCVCVCEEHLSPSPSPSPLNLSLPEAVLAAAIDGGGATVTSGMGNEDTGMGRQHT